MMSMISHKLSRFVAQNKFSVYSVSEFAKRIGIHPGIVVGRLQKENIIDFNRIHIYEKESKLKYKL